MQLQTHGHNMFLTSLDQQTVVSRGALAAGILDPRRSFSHIATDCAIMTHMRVGALLGKVYLTESLTCGLGQHGYSGNRREKSTMHLT